jgi:uncharacterized protein (DUF927 family)
VIKILLPGETFDFGSISKIAEMISDMDATAKNQKELTDGITMLREKARQRGIATDFDDLIKTLQGANSQFKIQYNYTFEDYTESETPYWDVFNQESSLAKTQRLEVLNVAAKDVGFKTFKAAYKAFCLNLRKYDVQVRGNSFFNPTAFSGQPLELDACDWRCDDDGIVKETPNGIEVACPHPILPIQRLINIDTNEEKMKIAYRSGKNWRTITVGKNDLYDSSKVLKLAGVGVAVTSKTARNLSDFLCNIECRNYELIETISSVTRLGYIEGGGFSPYVDDVVFDGDLSYGAIYDAISESGKYDEWLNVASKCRAEHQTAQIMLAASFASPLISRIGCLPFFVHLWGVESATGKTVALMLAASVWGNPAIGQYTQTFNSTQVGHEKTAAFLNNIPMMIDELQLSKDSHGHSKFDVYQLSQGVGRTRGNRMGGVDRPPTWSLCILSTGESPITSAASGAGAVNRVIDIECKAADTVIKDGFATSSAIKQHYGFAGRKFVEALTDDVVNEATERYKVLFKELTEKKTTEKQAMAAAVLIIADEIADKVIFKSGKTLTVDEISEYLKTKESVSAGERGYAFICDWVAMNSNRFLSTKDGNGGEIWGKIENNKMWINSTKLKTALQDATFSPEAIISWLNANSLLERKSGDRHYDVYTSVHGVRARYFIINQPAEDASGELVGEEFEELL